MTPRLLVVDDHIERGPAVAKALGFRCECRLVSGFDEAVRALVGGGDAWGAVVTDFDLGGHGTGMQVLELTRMLSERTLRVFYTSYYVDAVAQEALRRTHAHAVLDARAVDFLSRLRENVERLFDDEDGVGEADSESAPADTAPAEEQPLVAEWCAHSAGTRSLLAQLRGAAMSGGPVYAVGEEGSGKHLARRTLRAWTAIVERGGATEPPVAIVNVPPLRERRADIVPLSERLLSRLASTRPPAKRLDPEVAAVLSECDWTGNVRELHTVVLAAWQRAGDRPVIGLRDVGSLPETERNPLLVGRVEGELDRLLLFLRAERTVNAAARRAGQSPQNFRRAMDRLGVLRLDAGPGAGD